MEKLSIKNTLNLAPPTFGLNFVDNKKIKDKNFMLICGFENFE